MRPFDLDNPIDREKALEYFYSLPMDDDDSEAEVDDIDVDLGYCDDTPLPTILKLNLMVINK